MNKPTEEERKMWSNQMLGIFKKAAADLGVNLEPGDIIIEIKEDDAAIKNISDSLDKELDITRYDGEGIQTRIKFDKNKMTERAFKKIMQVADEKYGICIGRFTPEFGKLKLEEIKKDV